MIKKPVFFFTVLILLSIISEAQTHFEDFFTSKVLRVDYLLYGNDTSENVIIQQLKKEPYFAGSHHSLLDTLNYGTYRYKAYDLKTNQLIYSRGFCPLFQEWQTTEEAKKRMKGYYQVAILPFPKKDIRFTIEKRTYDGNFVELFSQELSPKDYFIINEAMPNYKVNKIKRNGDPKEKVDLVFLPEGYTADEMGKFSADIDRMLKALFKSDGFKGNEGSFNIYSVEVPSIESGTDVPGENTYKNTAFNSSFYTFDTPRYLTTSDLKSVHDAAALVPYDHVYVLVNTDRYGGGGFYNFMSLTSADHEKSEMVFVHEFGHGFAGLADEYYTSSVAFDGFYNLKVEPWEPNITTLVEFDKKWQGLVSKGIPIPTPRVVRYKKDVGVFEGGGYSAKGIYSPMMDCRMKTNEAKDFCPVCAEAIRKAIQLHCQ